MRARGSGAQIQSGEAKMWHGDGHRKAAGDCGPCDRHVRSGTESPQDSVRSFENAHIFSGDSRSEEKLGTCSVDITIWEYCLIPPGSLQVDVSFDAYSYSTLLIFEKSLFGHFLKMACR